MKLASLILGIVAIVGMLIGLIPCLGWFNWLNIPLAITGLIIGIVDYNNDTPLPPQGTIEGQYIKISKPFPVGVLLCSIALFFGIIRLILGNGII